MAAAVMLIPLAAAAQYPHDNIVAFF